MFRPGDFKAQLVGGGARSNLFEFRIVFPAALVALAGLASNKISFMAKAASQPASHLPSVEVPYFGRVIHVAGDRTFDPFTVTIISDEDLICRNALESWNDSIRTRVTNMGLVNPEDYKVDCEVIQYSKDQSILKTYQFVGCYPTEIGEVALAWDQNNAIQEFTTTFCVDWWDSATS